MIGRVLLALLLIFFSAACQARPSSVQIGMTLHLREADAASLSRQFDLMAPMKVRWVRVDIDWSAIESNAGQYDWTTSDLIVDEARARGIQVLAVLAYSPTWAVANPQAERATYGRPADVSTYTRFVRDAVTRYAARGVHTWEIWNEPNTSKFWPPGPDVGEYGRLFRAAAEVIRSLDPTATLLIGGLSPEWDGPTADMEPADYLERLYDDGAVQLADAVAVHPYNFPSFPMDSYQRTAGGFHDLPALHALMARRGDGNKKIWITEFGAPTGTGPNAVSERDQAATLLRARSEAAQWDWAGPLIYYELVDGGTDPHDIEENFGVLRADYSPKLAARALMDTA